LPPQVLSVTPTLGTDWDGESAVFFEVILADKSVPRPQLLAFTKQISRASGDSTFGGMGRSSLLQFPHAERTGQNEGTDLGMSEWHTRTTCCNSLKR
jgi:hypothetical protein